MLTVVLQSSSSATKRGLQQTVGDLQPIASKSKTHDIQMLSGNDSAGFLGRILLWVVCCVIFDSIASTDKIVPTGMACPLEFRNDTILAMTIFGLQRSYSLDGTTGTATAVPHTSFEILACLIRFRDCPTLIHPVRESGKKTAT